LRINLNKLSPNGSDESNALPDKTKDRATAKTLFDTHALLQR
jgi:hypothetical protein